MNVQTIATTGLGNGNFSALRRPASRRSRLMCRVNRIGKENGFIIGQAVQKIIISLDKQALLGWIQLTGNGLEAFDIPCLTAPTV